MIKLLVGLGNPGAEYEATRHNAGFWWIDQLARQLGVHLVPERSYFGLMARTQWEGHTLWLLQPQTFMNRSGQSVAGLARFYRIKPEEILVVHDELDLPPGETRLKNGGSHAGHNGLRDIHAQLGSPAYWRLRIGVGHPGDRAEVVNWVLKKPAPEHREAIEDAIARTLKAFPELVHGRMEKATAWVNTSKPPRPKQPRPTSISARSGDVPPKGKPSQPSTDDFSLG
jgi:PTH1 family peptidyl-tRNA hydrolase